MNGKWIALAAVLLLATACSPREPTASSADVRVAELLARMTLAEKIQMLHGVPENPASDQGQAGYLPGIARLGIASLRLADGPPGVLTRYPATGLPATMALAATFSSADARALGGVIGRDAKALGIDVVLEPYINIHRDQTFERAYNTYGEDPLLTGAIGAGLIEGIQAEGVMAQAKHYLAYDGATDVTVDDQTLHEIYLPPFAAAVAAHVSSIMCSYNVINGAYACGNAATLDHILRGELHFDGFVTSDWGAVHGTPFINAGLDLEMPGSGTVMDSYFQEAPNARVPRKPLAGPVTTLMPEEPTAAPGRAPSLAGTPPIGMLAAMQKGSVTEATVTRAAARILTQMERFRLLDRSSHIASPSGVEPAGELERNAQIVRGSAEDAAVLLKNNDQALPLTQTDLGSLAMIGPGALQDIAIGKSGEKALGHVERQQGPAQALAALTAADAAGSGVHLRTAVADDMSGSAIPAAALLHANQPGLQRDNGDGRAIGVDAQLDFSRLCGNALPAGSTLRWSGELHIARAGRYRLYLQVLGASAQLTVDGARVAASGPLDLHGNVLQPGQDSLLPSNDGLDNVRSELELSAGTHPIMVQVSGDESGQPVQIRLAWVTPEQRAADFRQAVQLARQVHTAVVFAWSRGLPAYGLPGDQNQLIAAVAAANPNTIVVLNLSEPVAMPWLEQVKSVLLMWYPGDEGGAATADVLTGRAVPAGRLPFTWPRSLQQTLTGDPLHPERSSSGIDGSTRYSEGIMVGYRWFDQQQIEPLYPFGFGLSYTHFDYSQLSVTAATDGGLDASVQLRNAGSRDADEVVQVYLGAPSVRPDAMFAERALATFQRVHLAAGESQRLTLHVPARALQYWSSAERRWRTAVGARLVYVGASSRDLRLQQSVTVAGS